MPASYPRPWWVGFLVGFVLALLSLAAGLWQLGIVAAGVAGYLSGKGRAGAIRGVQAVGPAWIVWLLALSLASPIVDDLVVLMAGSSEGAGASSCSSWCSSRSSWGCSAGSRAGTSRRSWPARRRRRRRLRPRRRRERAPSVSGLRIGSGNHHPAFKYQAGSFPRTRGGTPREREQISWRNG